MMPFVYYEITKWILINAADPSHAYRMAQAMLKVAP